MTRRGRTVVRVLALLCVLGAAAALVSAVRDDEPAAAAPAATQSDSRLQTPVLSPRRAPAVFLDAAARVRLGRTLQETVGGYTSCAAVDTPAGERLTTIGDNTVLAAGSNQKLLIAAAALKVLGPDRKLVTRAVSDAPLEQGALHGDLTIVGGGDPLLATPAYEQYWHELPRFRDVPVTRLTDLADAIAAAGIRHIDGALVADDSRYDSTRYNADWKSNYVPDGEIGPVGALTVDGGFADPRAPIPAPDPALLAVQRLRELLAQRGISVGGENRRGNAPENARPIAEKASLPVAGLVGVMLRASDNYAAELLTREIGVVAAKNGTTPAGLEAVTAAVKDLGVPTDGVELIDGSGLAPSNRVTCDALMGVLSLTGRAPFDAITRGLPVAGQSGTLATRFIGDPLAGILRAKTGDINGVVGFSGTVDDKEDLRFAFAANGGFSTDQGRFLQGQIARAVAAYPDVNGLFGLVPAPASSS